MVQDLGLKAKWESREKRGKGVLDRGHSLCKSFGGRKEAAGGALDPRGDGDLPSGRGEAGMVLREGVYCWVCAESYGGKGQAWALLWAGQNPKRGPTCECGGGAGRFLGSREGGRPLGQRAAELAVGSRPFGGAARKGHGICECIGGAQGARHLQGAPVRSPFPTGPGLLHRPAARTGPGGAGCD